MQEEHILEMRNISKSFPGVKALDDVSFDLRKGEVHCLIGENGAGKSTLMKILSGSYHPDAGSIVLDGKPISFNSPSEALYKGISMIHQELNLLPELSVMENIYLGHEIRKKTGAIDWKSIYRETQSLLSSLGISLDGRAKVADLGIGNKQLASIAKALSFKSRIIIMDEPSATLIGNELRILFDVIRKLKSQGISVIYISHRLEEIKEIGDRITVMRDGRKIISDELKNMEIQDIVRYMVGRDLSSMFAKERRAIDRDDTVLKVGGLTKRGLFSDISFELHKGEILGFAGLIGAGRTEIAKAIMGADTADSGTIEVDGETAKIKTVMDAVAYGIGLIPEDRRQEGTVVCRSVRENIAYTVLDEINAGGFLKMKLLEEIVDRYVDNLSIKIPHKSCLTGKLSGGNQQKVVVAKWLAADSDILIMDEPTRGIDIGAKAEIYRLMDRLTAEGHAIILISSELPEIMAMSDRILVVSEGRITKELDPENTTEEEILSYTLPASKKVNPPVNANENGRRHA
jgi:ribose transport system ATP-binding protein